MRALVLGGTGAIGTAIAHQLTKEGHQVTATGQSTFDLTDERQIAAFFESTGATFEILVHAAGVNVPKTFEALTDTEIRASVDANLFGFLDVVRHCLPHWRSRSLGRVVVLSSLYGSLGRAGRLPYVISKHALNGAVKTLAIELGCSGVLVNSVSPGYIETPLTLRNNQPSTLNRLVTGIPIGRMGTAAEVAQVVTFLCSEQNTYLTGQDIVVDGGFSVGGFQ